MKRLVTTILFLVCSLPASVYAAAGAPAFGQRGMVVASVEPAVGAGREMLALGGNAIDAAVATAFAAGVAHQFSSGIGGGAFIVVHLADGSSYAVDARERAPASASRDMYLDAEGKADPKASRIGARAVAVPSLVQGLEQVHARFGKLEWARVVAPAIRLASEGVEIGPHHRRILMIVKDRLAAHPETARTQLIDGQVPQLGQKLVQPDLARTLRKISRQGSKAITQGELAEKIVKASEGVITLEDLASYPVVWREPVRGQYRGYQIVSMPPPSSGGVLLVELLNALEPFDLKAMGHNSSETIHLVSQALKLAFADRAAHLGDSDFYPVPMPWLTSKAYGMVLAERLRTPPFWRRAPWNWGQPYMLKVDGPTTPPPDDAGTTHLSVMDEEGNAVALTQTVNTLFGSLITVPGTGIVLNNEMDDFSAAPGELNSWGAVGSTANSIEPGKRPLSSMTPTIVTRDGRAQMALGSPMGTIIISTVLQTLINVIDFGLDPQAAVSSPRFHHQWRPDAIMLEPEHPRDVREALEEIGHQLVDRGFHLGAAELIVRDPETGAFYGGADPRRDSGAAGL